MLLGAISIIIGYLLGSVSPSYILGKLLKGIDIREHGDGNAGTTNTKKVLGIGPAIIAAIYDLGKGLLSIWIAYKLGADPVFMYAAGYAAILGHVFPFYLGFRGGQGVATAATDPGATGGAATHTLIIAETPSHTHPISEGNAVGAGDFLPQTGSTGAGATDAIGGDGAHENEPTFYDIAFLMKS